MRMSSEYLGATLTDYDGARFGDLVAEDLDTEPLSAGVAAVLGASGSFLVGGLDGKGEAGWMGDGELQRAD